MIQKFRVPVGVLICVAVGLVVLFVMDAMMIMSDAKPFQSDLRLLLILSTTGAAVWLTARLVRTWFDQTGTKLERIEQLILAREGPTIPIPRIIATVPPAVRRLANDDELPGYSKGYVDGLTRKPMANGNGTVIPIEGRT